MDEEVDVTGSVLRGTSGVCRDSVIFGVEVGEEEIEYLRGVITEIDDSCLRFLREVSKPEAPKISLR